jgi:hypothetical protein
MRNQKAEEEEAYNPYDTSELENQGSMTDTVYSVDSVGKSFNLKEKHLTNTKN